jgi:hypothetical protein
MNVAWHVMPGSTGIASPSRRERSERFDTKNERLSIMGRPTLTKDCLRRGEADHTVPYGTVHLGRFPRHCVPGYRYQVPTGQNLQLIT